MAMNSKTLVKEMEQLHTNIPGEIYRKLQKYGNGFLNQGIIKVVEVAEKNWKLTSLQCGSCRRLNNDICGLIGAKPTFSENCEFHRL